MKEALRGFIMGSAAVATMVAFVVLLYFLFKFSPVLCVYSAGSLLLVYCIFHGADVD